jgi:hypothetical protein
VGTCEEIPFYSQALGLPCDNMLQCDTTGICASDDGGQNYCLPRNAAGEPCDRYAAEISAWCQIGLACDNPDGGGWICVNIPGEGEPCDYPTGCRDELKCLHSTLSDYTSPEVCTRYLHGPGDPCYDNDFLCTDDGGNPGFCLYDGGVTYSGGPGVCSGLLGTGATCFGGGQCHSGKCLMVDGGPTFVDSNTGAYYTGVCLPDCI